MDKAKAAITDFMSRSGHHDTTVHEAVAPAVQHETVKPHQHEEINTAIDKEVHQDHYHRTVQPVHDREVLPETHTAKLGAVQHREFDHRDHDSTKRNLVQDQSRFKDERRVEGATSSQSVAPAVGGEHVHHHIHETIQPVVQKETIQPNVVHTTVPIHEVHHNKATHHDTTSLPAMTMDQFKSKGGALTGREERYDEFQGAPKNIGGGTAGGFGAVRDLEHKVAGQHGKDHARHGDYDAAPNHHSDAGLRQGGLTSNSTTSGSQGLTGHDNHHHTTGGLTGSSTTGGLTGHNDHHHADRGVAGQGNLTGSSTQGGILSSGDRHHDGMSSTRSDLNDTSRDGPLRSTGTTGRVGTDGVIGGISGRGLDHRPNEDGDLPKALTEDRSKAEPHSTIHDNQHSTGRTSHDTTTSTNTSGTQHKPSLMDKLNPKVDSNGDGKAGFMK